MAEITLSEIMHSIPSHFDREKAKGFSGIVQCYFTGEGASDWVVRIENQICDVSEGLAPWVDLTVEADTQDGVDVFLGKLDAMRAYLSGRIKVSGDLSLGMKLIGLFNR